MLLQKEPFQRLHVKSIRGEREKRLQRICLHFWFLLSVLWTTVLFQRRDHIPSLSVWLPKVLPTFSPCKGICDYLEDTFTGADLTPRYSQGHWVTWLNTGIQIKENQILMVAWSKMNINELISRWEVKSSQESICWVGGNKGNVVCKRGGRNKQTKKNQCGWLKICRIWAGNLLN